ncbi:MAG: TonB-dependent receptor [Bacteroidetes bacterium]|nr:TonB-dependent receptor [Bacteroidota bacterium]
MRYLYLLILTINPLFLFGQSFSGKVVDKLDRPLAYAHIYLQGSQNHAHTNEFGLFKLDGIESGDTIVISLLGYKTHRYFLEELEEPQTFTLAESPLQLDEVVVSTGIDAQQIFTEIDLKTNPVSSSQEVLRTVPGLIIGQHAGGGKAEQIFLRGFDIDHGTDINLTVDGMPVNMVSHAHGQGYSDLHFLIPEIIDGVDFGKGPYYAEQGNFTTAGYVDFQTKDRLDNSLLQLERGMFNQTRFLGAFDLIDNKKHAAWIASEFLFADGPFESPQGLSRFNFMGKYATRLANYDKITVSGSHFTSTWDASGQIPQRQVDNGAISRFGAIDDTEGGTTSRTNLNFSYNKYINDNSFIRNSAYYARYDFELFSNFTFFLDDPENGDQIRQSESREIFGLKSEWNQAFDLGETSTLLKLGTGIRQDKVDDILLSHTANRSETLEEIQRGNLNETNSFAYVNANIEIGKLTINPGLRADLFMFTYQDALVENYQRTTVNKGIVSPKLNFFYDASQNLQLFLKTGKGFHSNDTRVVVARDGREVLPSAYGADLGVIFKPAKRLLIQSAIWYLFLEQEFVYVGDAGIVEPSGKTNRAGIDLGVRYQIADFLFLQSDINYTHARSAEDPEGSNYIPLAPDLTASAGLNLQHPTGFYFGLQYRFINDRPANEDYSITAEGYQIFDLTTGYQWGNLDFGIAVQNLLNTEWKETQFATESRLDFETEPVEEIHFIPGTPFFLKGIIRYKF